jgi:NitT/TauT family transport system substrate-binding protein
MADFGFRRGRLSVDGAINVLFGAAIALSAAIAPAQADTKVRYVEVVRNLAYLPSYVALAKGYFKDAGLDVSVSTAQGGDKATAMMLAGNADITLVGPETAVYVWNSESPEKMKIFCSLTGTSTNFFISRKKMDPASFKWSMIKGATVLGWRPGSTPELFMEYAMRKNGIDPAKDITDVTNIAVPARFGAWISGKGDYAIFSEPELTRIEKDGKGYPVRFVGADVGQVDYTLFMATDTYIKKNPKIIQDFTNAVYKAQLFTKTADPMELGKLVAKYFPVVSPQDIAASVVRYRKVNLWRDDPVVYEKPMETLQDILIQGGAQKADKRVKYSDIVLTSFAEKAKATIH